MITVNCSIALFFLGMLILAVYSIPKIKIKKEFLAIENTNATKGIAILMIILAHIMQYAGNSVTVIGGGGALKALYFLLVRSESLCSFSCQDMETICP